MPSERTKPDAAADLAALTDPGGNLTPEALVDRWLAVFRRCYEGAFETEDSVEHATAALAAWLGLTGSLVGQVADRLLLLIAIDERAETLFVGLLKGEAASAFREETARVREAFGWS